MQPMQVENATKVGIRCPGVQMGHPALGGYKYGELALQVGGWATGGQRVTERELDVRKHKLQLEKGQAKVKKQS